MCIAFISVEPALRWPVLVLFVRDGYRDRAWRLPGAHWPSQPAVLGGLDLLAGGTWLALDRGTPIGAAQGQGRGQRLACLLNGAGVPAHADSRRSRGGVPLTMTGTGSPEGLDLERYDPFHLVYADRAGAQVMSWSGQMLTTHELTSGMHAVAEDGLVGPGGRTAVLSVGSERSLARVEHARRRLEAVTRPEPGTGGTAAARGAWLAVASADAAPAAGSSCLMQAGELRRGRWWSTTSVALVALGRESGPRFDFDPDPVAGGAWYEVAMA
ncbi:NRDE family protein [Streptomyces sp. NPDC060028]|uniref:NRDE family protein n=1 Tax=Streptomyces sp. NPDC060028 TaxID=3347041 RepID=UPI0036AB25FB